METNIALLAVLCVLVTVLLVLIIFVLVKQSGNRDGNSELLQMLRKELMGEQRESRRETANNLSIMTDMIQKSQQSAFMRQDARLDALTKGISDSLRSIDDRFKSFSLQSEQKLDNIRTTMENRLASLQDDNNKKLEQMRQTVDEKLQKTLEEK
ncbi:MAG: hypothetical protein RRY38_02265, partial [Oscillospiraceae bacterium]